MAEVVLDKVTKRYPNGFQAVTELDLEVADGEFLVLVGPSGCGKSTALRMVAGLEEISDGILRIGDKVVNDVHPKDRDIAMVFQNYALYPHMSVADNIGFALKLAKVPRSEIERRVNEAASILELEPVLDRKPGQLSGGQRQRVAMGRAIVRQPAAFLMDEPLSNLDAKLRVQMRAEIARLQRNLGVTTIYVTHDQVEAMTMGDRVAVLNAGLLQQVASPQHLYDRPDNLFVAAFIGSPAMNLFEGTLVAGANGLAVRLGDHDLALDPATVSERPALAAYRDRPLVVGFRPEDLDDPATLNEVPQDHLLPARIELVEALGSELVVHFGITAKAAETGDPDRVEEARITTGADGQPKATCVARFSPYSKVRSGEDVMVAVETRNFHFFDPSNGAAIWG